LPSPLAYAQCMRSHGIANFADPSPQDIRTSGGVIAIAIGRGIDSRSPFVESAMKACAGPARPSSR